MDKSNKNSNKTKQTSNKSTSKNSNKKVSKTSSKASNKASNKAKRNSKVKIEKKNSKKAVTLAVVIILSLLVIAVSVYLIKSSKFNITSIAVSGNTKVNTDEVISKSGISLGDNAVKSVFRINKQSILNIPYIESINVSINFPSEFVIKVNERKSIYFAYDKEKNIYYKIDENGVILEVCNGIEFKEQELLINGITFDDEVKLNTKINDIDYSKILVYKEIETEFYNVFTDRNITKVNFENSLTKIYLNDKIEVILPNNTNLKYNLTFLKDILNSVGDTQGTIDMTKENPTFIAF